MTLHKISDHGTLEGDTKAPIYLWLAKRPNRWQERVEKVDAALYAVLGFPSPLVNQTGTSKSILSAGGGRQSVYRYCHTMSSYSRTRLWLAVSGHVMCYQWPWTAVVPACLLYSDGRSRGRRTLARGFRLPVIQVFSLRYSKVLFSAWSDRCSSVTF